MEMLKKATQKQHAAIEHSLDLTNSGFTLESYGRLLEKFYGYYLPWERLCRPSIEAVLPGFFESRLKSPLLQQDLTVLGRDLRTIPHCSFVPGIRNLSGALGSMYVVEGSTLGGRVLSRHFADALGVNTQTGGRFFAGYGERTGSMWREFAATIEANVSSPEDAIDSAQRTFDTLREWLEAR